MGYRVRRSREASVSSMSSVTRPKGPLPARVYWVRRLIVLAVALLLVVGLARLLGGGGGGDPASAVPVAGTASTTPSAPASSGPTTTAQAMSSGDPTPSSTAPGAVQDPGRPEAPSPVEQDEPTVLETPLAMPTGPCDDSDVQVTPVVRRAHAGRNVRIVLKLSTRESAACTWKLSARSVVVKLTSGDDRIWSTQDCPSAVPEKSLVLRDDQVTRARVIWKGQRSDDGCTGTTPWAMPGYYHAHAAALGADPVDEQFRLLSAATPTRTVTPTPTPRDKGARSDQAEGRDGSDRASSGATPDAQQTGRPDDQKTD